MIGFLHGGARDAFVPMVAAFRRGLSEQGYEQDRNRAEQSACEQALSEVKRLIGP
jgi:hypothetical protein